MKKLSIGYRVGLGVATLMVAAVAVTPAQAPTDSPSQFLIVYSLAHETMERVTPEEQPKFQEHYQYMKRHFEQGRLTWGGRVLDPLRPRGLVVITGASEADARAYASGDPAVRAGVLKATVEPFNEVLRAGASAPVSVTQR